MVKLLVGYVHLLATCLALGSILTTDWRLYRGRYYPLRQGARARLTATRSLVLYSLALLWITGPLLIWLAYAADPQQFAISEKLWAKITVVMVLTINGWALHAIAFPQLNGSGALMDRSFSRRLSFAALGAVSVVSWLFAAFLGLARNWNVGVSYEFVTTLYSVLLAAAIASAALLFADRGAPRSLASSERAGT